MKRLPIKTDVKRAVRMLDNRVDSLAGTQRFMINVQLDQLVKAEKLRKLAIAATSSLGTVVGVGSAKVRALDAFVRNLEPFSKPARQLEKLRKAIR